MSNKVSLTDLLTAIGSENIRYQDLMKNIENIKSKRGETVISFVTDATSPGDFVTGSGPKGLILWVDDDVFKQCFDELKAGNSLTYEKILEQRDELLTALSAASEKMKAAHESMFEQCLSNPVCNAWGKEINLSAINELQLAAPRIDSAIAKAKGGEA